MSIEEQFEALSANGKAYIEAMVKFSEITHPVPVAGPELFGLTITIEHLRNEMSEEQGQAVSDYAHRRDYPDMYSEDGKALTL